MLSLQSFERCRRRRCCGWSPTSSTQALPIPQEGSHPPVSSNKGLLRRLASRISSELLGVAAFVPREMKCDRLLTAINHLLSVVIIAGSFNELLHQPSDEAALVH